MYFSRILIRSAYFSIVDSAFDSMSLSSSTEYSLLTLGLFLIFLAQAPKRNVDIVSSRLNSEGEHVMIKHVLEFPPNESYNTHVSLESQYGTWVEILSVRCLITIPRVVNDLLILVASLSVTPLAPVLFTFSLPAKSTRYNLPDLQLRSSELF